MERNHIRWAIVGCGRVVDRRVAPVFAKMEDAQLAAFCSRDRARARAFCERFGAEHAYTSLERLLADDVADAVYIATPNALHAEQAIACLQAGRHVLVDKPMATSAADAERMAEAARRADRKLGVLHQQRLHPANMHLLRLIDEGELGQVRFARVQIAMWLEPSDGWRGRREMSGGGAAIDLAPHALDLLRAIGGSPRCVTACTCNLQFETDVEDFCSARIEFESGAIGLMDVHHCAKNYGGRVEVFGSEATYISEGSMQQAEVFYTALERGGAPVRMQQDVCATNCFHEVLSDFTDAVLHGGEPSINMNDGLRVMQMIDAIYESARSGKTVEFDALPAKGS